MPNRLVCSRSTWRCGTVTLAETGDLPVHDFPYFSGHDLVHVTGGTILETISSNLMMSFSLTQKNWSVLENRLDICIPSGGMVSSVLDCTTIRCLFREISQKKSSPAGNRRGRRRCWAKRNDFDCGTEWQGHHSSHVKLWEMDCNSSSHSLVLAPGGLTQLSHSSLIILKRCRNGCIEVWARCGPLLQNEKIALLYEVCGKSSLENPHETRFHLLLGFLLKPCTVLSWCNQLYWCFARLFIFWFKRFSSSARGSVCSSLTCRQRRSYHKANPGNCLALLNAWNLM